MRVNKNTKAYQRFEWWFRRLHADQRAKKFGGDWKRTDWGYSKNIDNYNVSLCSYFWAAYFKYWFARYGDWIMGTLLGTIALTFFGIAHYGLYVSGGWLAILGFYGILLGLLGAAAGIAFIADLRDRRRFSEPSAFTEYYKAKKQKVCPIIEFEE